MYESGAEDVQLQVQVGAVHDLQSHAWEMQTAGRRNSLGTAARVLHDTVYWERHVKTA